MRILVFINSLYTGGAEFSTLSLYGWLKKMDGYEVKLVCYKRATPAYDPAQFGFMQVDFIEGHTFLGRLKSLKKIIHEFKPQLIHSVLFDANLLTRFARLTSKSFIHLESLVNEVYSPHRLLDPNVNWLKLRGYQCIDWLTQMIGVDHYHATGVSVASHYKKALGIHSNRITVINRGRQSNVFYQNTETASQLRASLNITPDTIILIHAARHEFQKGHDVLLKALVSLTTKKPWVCLLAGREGNLTTSILQQIKDSELTNKVKVLGHREDIAQLLAIADIFVFPTRFEGLPGALLEAEAAGLPIVCTDIDNNKEVVEENVNALLCKVNDSLTLSEHIEVLIDNDQKRKIMGKQSYLIFNKRFTLEEAHTRMEELLKGLMKST